MSQPQEIPQNSDVHNVIFSEIGLQESLKGSREVLRGSIANRMRNTIALEKHGGGEEHLSGHVEIQENLEGSGFPSVTISKKK